MKAERHEIDRVKATFDLRHYAEQALGYRPASRGSEAWTFRCPFHQERKGAALAVWADGWRCFGACQEGGDAITFLRKLHPTMSFEEAVRLMGGDLTLPAPTHQSGLSTAPAPTPRADPPPVELQQVARQLVERAHEALFAPQGQAGLDYLVRQRRLTEPTIRDARLGYVRPSPKRNWIVDGIQLPGHCITLPWFAGGHLWGVKCRLLAGGDLRYLNFTTVEKGMGEFNLDGSLYWADEVVPGWDVLVVEGEFNALTAWQEFPDVLCTVSLGPAGHTLNPRWYGLLAAAPTIYGLYDDDPAGQKGAQRLARLSSAVRPIHLPAGIKDLNDFKRISFDLPQAAVFHWARKTCHAA